MKSRSHNYKVVQNHQAIGEYEPITNLQQPIKLTLFSLKE